MGRRESSFHGVLTVECYLGNVQDMMDLEKHHLPIIPVITDLGKKC